MFVFAAGLLCPKTLYVIAMLFPYAPINKNGLNKSCADTPLLAVKLIVVTSIKLPFAGALLNVMFALANV
jgi:hypothetical protein